LHGQLGRARTVQTFVQPGLTAGGTGNTLDPQNATAFSVAISDPDAPDARSYGDINFDGDEERQLVERRSRSFGLSIRAW